MVVRASVAYSRFSRRRKASRIGQFIARNGVRTVLLVGAESASFAWSNIVERAVMASATWVVVSGLGPDLDFPGATRVFCDGRSLPFRDRAFDLVVSNAVVEHVGDEEDQRAFLREHYRVGRHYVVTTPNKWFPVESHTRVLLRHWSARWRNRHGAEFSRLLSRRELTRMLPDHRRVIRGGWLAPTFTVEGLGMQEDPGAKG